MLFVYITNKEEKESDERRCTDAQTGLLGKWLLLLLLLLTKWMIRVTAKKAESRAAHWQQTHRYTVGRTCGHVLECELQFNCQNQFGAYWIVEQGLYLLFFFFFFFFFSWLRKIFVVTSGIASGWWMRNVRDYDSLCVVVYLLAKERSKERKLLVLMMMMMMMHIKTRNKALIKERKIYPFDLNQSEVKLQD